MVKFGTVQNLSTVFGELTVDFRNGTSSTAIFLREHFFWNKFVQRFVAIAVNVNLKQNRFFASLA